MDLMNLQAAALSLTRVLNMLARRARAIRQLALFCRALTTGSLALRSMLLRGQPQHVGGEVRELLRRERRSESRHVVAASGHDVGDSVTGQRARQRRPAMSAASACHSVANDTACRVELLAALQVRRRSCATSRSRGLGLFGRSSHDQRRARGPFALARGAAGAHDGFSEADPQHRHAELRCERAMGRCG